MNMPRRALVPCLPFALVTVLGCPSDDAGPRDTRADGDDETASPADSSSSAGGGSSTTEPSNDEEEDPDTLGSEGSSSEGSAPVVCDAPSAGPTHHDEDVVGHEVWTAAGSPHIVDWTVDVRGGAILEIEPCAVVQLAEGHGINVAYPGTPTTGTLVAEGTAEQPIRFEGLDGAAWSTLFVQSPGTMRLAHVTISGGGTGDQRGTSLLAQGESTFPVQPALFVDHVTVESSAGIGVRVIGLAGFIDGSTDLVVTDSGSAADPYPVWVDTHAAGSLPSGTYTGNVVDKILIDPVHNVGEDVTLRDLGITYMVGGTLVVASGDASAPATLTLEPGVRMEFAAGESLEIEHYTGEFMASGVLVAEGTAADPVVLTSAADAPQPGDWSGIWFGGTVQPATQLDHVRLEYTGADCGCLLISCSDVENTEGAVIMSMEPDHVFVTNSVIADGSANGFVLGYDGSELDFRNTNTFEDLAGCPTTAPRDGACEQPLPSCL